MSQIAASIGFVLQHIQKRKRLPLEGKLLSEAKLMRWK